MYGEADFGLWALDFGYGTPPKAGVGERLYPLPPLLFAAAKPPPRIVIASSPLFAGSVAWQSGALRFGLTHRHGAASPDAAPRDDNVGRGRDAGGRGIPLLRKLV